MQSIPKFLRSEPSPRVQDSAFPPFKVEHRYRGVYERAGFEVYRGDGKPRSDNSTPRTRAGSTFSSNSSVISPNHPGHNGTTGPYTRQHNSEAGRNQKGYNPYDNTHTGRNKSHGDLYTRNIPEHDGMYQNRSASQPDALKNYQVIQQPIGNTLTDAHFDDDNSIPARSAERNLDIQKQHNKSNSSFNFSPSMGSKNYMGLSLNLSNDPVDLGPLSDDIETSKSNYDSYTNEQYTNATSVRASDEMMSQAASIQTDELMDTPERRRKYQQQQIGLPTPPKSSGEALDDTLVRRERLSTALSGIQTDFKQRNQAPPPEFKVEEPRISYAQNDQITQSDASNQFDAFKLANDQTSNNLNLDYQNFLNSDNGNNRHSQLSMVSSIISKESRYSDDDDNEVQQELERQLENLKKGGSAELLTKPAKQIPYPPEYPEDQSLDTSDIDNTIEQVNQISPSSPVQVKDDNVPSFSIEPSTPTRTDSDSMDSIQPLSVRHSKIKTTFALPDITKTPKVDNVNEDLNDAPELPDLNREPVTEFNGVPEVLDFNTDNEHRDKDINSLSNGLEEVKLNKAAIPEFKYPSGSGPCRSCKQKISPEGKGPKKAVYSKTGELTGQWHRECFKCSNSECDISFNKSVQCYVLDDEAYCNHHYHILNHSLCEMCQVGIEGECIENEVEQKWHLHCLRCFKCNNTINSDYYLINDAIYCDHDAINIISGQASYNDAYGNSRNGLTTNDKVEKRRTRLMHIDQY